jgi:hypothetical protein
MAFGQSQQERENQTVESMVAGLLSQLQQPNSEDQSYQGLKEGHGRIRIGAGSSDPKGRVISQIPWSHHEQQQSRASISTLLASLDPSTLQSLMAGAPSKYGCPTSKYGIASAGAVVRPVPTHVAGTHARAGSSVLQITVAR